LIFKKIIFRISPGISLLKKFLYPTTEFFLKESAQNPKDMLILFTTGGTGIGSGI